MSERAETVRPSLHLSRGKAIACALIFVAGMLAEASGVRSTVGNAVGETASVVGTAANNVNYGARVWVADRLEDGSWAWDGASKFVNPGPRESD